ncbi:T9SS type A sorting domain-containing protein [Rufibacter sp. DG15C]|uniref:T9SS type A sorting domain-containing protein n=1 Tax=Rufibacter sp. DG15C TaxID=1379909 RepID=UPI00082E7CE4|nr:T9SS type A sorting domain-containing protein [Rufibacter sp. DG15C]
MVPFGSSWQYLDDGSNQGTAWQSPTFNSSAWKTGVGKFGYGIVDAATLVGYGPDASNKYITTYFRKTISLPDPGTLGSISANIRLDDGAVIYVNGVEMHRINMPTGTITYNTLTAISSSGDGSKTLTFTINSSAFVSGTNVIAVEVHQSKINTSDMAFDLQLSSSQTGSGGGDVTPPYVVSILRQNPTSSVTPPGPVTFRVTFSERVTGVSTGDFSLATTNTASGTITGITSVGTAGSQYDVGMNTAGAGSLRLDLKTSGNGITDASSNAISGGFSSGESYTLQAPTSGGTGFAAVTHLTPTSITTNTADKPQSKVWSYAGKYWTVLTTSDGIYLWRLDGTSWTRLLRLSSSTKARADCKAVGSLTHVLLFRGDNTSYLVSLEYNASLGTYQLWTQRTARASIEFEDGAETATMDIDGIGRMWIASDDDAGNVNIRWSDAPYSNWNLPIVVATGTKPDDITSLVAMPGKVGVLWSNQNTKRFGFRTHADGASPSSWSADESPAAASALNMGAGMADDHLNIAIAGDGTLYCAVKTGYDAPDFTKLALLVRRPSGAWDPLYEVSEYEGTRPIALLNEAVGKIRVAYTSKENGGDLLYRESSLANITFSSPITLLSGLYNYVSSTKNRFSSETVLVATDVSSSALKAVGFLVSDAGTMAASSQAVVVSNELIKAPEAFPNPFTRNTNLRFSLQWDSEFSADLFDGRGNHIRTIGKGKVNKSAMVHLEIDGTDLTAGLYFVRMTTESGTKTIRLVKNTD